MYYSYVDELYNGIAKSLKLLSDLLMFLKCSNSRRPVLLKYPVVIMQSVGGDPISPTQRSKMIQSRPSESKTMKNVWIFFYFYENHSFLYYSCCSQFIFISQTGTFTNSLISTDQSYRKKSLLFRFM